MSDPQAPKPETPIGEPVAEPAPVDDVVDSAHGSLADAEAAREGVPADAASENATAPGDDTARDDAAVVDVPESVVEPSASSEAETVVVAPAASTDDETPWYDRPEHYEAVDSGTAAGAAQSEPAYIAPAEPAYVAPAPQPIFVQAPEAPLPRGNRAAAGAIGLLAALSFAALLLLFSIGFGLITGDVTTANIVESTLAALGTWTLWVPVVVFFLAFWLLGAIINRGRWGHWVVFGLLVGVASYGGYILGQLFQEPFWMLSASEGAALVEGQLLAPLAIASFVIGRELTIWFGAWAAARGKRVTELNLEAQREYERTLEAGPQLVRR
ncbi:MAG TPA: ABC transporter [Microbacterium sp.]|uniref:ABC transporter n=1 Tax=Microbacterium sp. TaxID=51671 RepID=UPI002C6E6C65|nr:ABC transporter [Microbacterium sp.]HWI31942.1 ABC transporter [Microbacterium sp.]